MIEIDNKYNLVDFKGGFSCLDNEETVIRDIQKLIDETYKTFKPTSYDARPQILLDIAPQPNIAPQSNKQQREIMTPLLDYYLTKYCLSGEITPQECIAKCLVDSVLYEIRYVYPSRAVMFYFERLDYYDYMVLKEKLTKYGISSTDINGDNVTIRLERRTD